MEPYQLKRASDGQLHAQTRLRGLPLLNSPMHNKGTAFTREERISLGLEGLLPDAVSSMEQQARRVYANLQRKATALEKYVGLSALQNRNEYLFYRVLVDHIEELLPIVYTPTVGLACQEYSHIFRRGRGIWLTPGHRGRMYEVLANTPFEDIRLIVVTDNERILGLGDQGAGGMGIPIGKLSLYTAAAGIHPAQTLPISLDVGTDNKQLLGDDLYLGWRKPRLRGAEYDALVEEFVQAVKRRFPKALLQWEDFKKGIAFKLLDRYRESVPSFNDDIQGTAAVAAAGMMAGTRVTGIPLVKQQVVILGAGAAGIGIARLMRDTLKRAGLAGEALTRAVAVLDSQGFLVDDEEIRDVYKREFAWPAALATQHGLGKGQPRNLEAVVRALHPTVLVGTSGEPGTFTEGVIREMAKHVERPVIFPMSNPTSMSEATPADVLTWTQGKALVATGSPFEPVTMDGKTHFFGQGNNAFIFPGVGLGVLLSEARRVSDGMFAAASHALAAEVRQEDLDSGRLFPQVRELRRVTAKVAEAVVREAVQSGLASRKFDESEIAALVKEAIWDPKYVPLEPV